MCYAGSNTKRELPSNSRPPKIYHDDAEDTVVSESRPLPPFFDLITKDTNGN